MIEHTHNPPVVVESATPEASTATTDDIFISVSRYGALFTAWFATAGSLFASDVIGWLPCVLCWYQRILMYPLALLLATGILRRDDRMYWYVLPLSLSGFAVASYHYILLKTDWFEPQACAAGIPCTTEYLNLLGFINLPFLALLSFAIISAAMAMLALTPPANANANATDAARPQSRPPFLMVFGCIASVVVAFVLARQWWLG